MNIFNRIVSLILPKDYIQPSREYLYSEEYKLHMTKHLDKLDFNILNEAQLKSKNYVYRHHIVNHKLGVFRWRGIQKHMDKIIKLASDNTLFTVDLGGAASPLGFRSIIVDMLDKDIYGNQILYNSLDDINSKIDFLFSSHTLEHIPELDTLLLKISNKLSTKGICIFHLPAYTCVRWRSGIHKNQRYNDHCWTFGLSVDNVPNNSFKRYIEIDTLISKYLNIDQVEYCGDNSIYIEASINEK